MLWCCRNVENMRFSLFNSACPDLLLPNVRNTKLTSIVRIAPRKPPSHSWQNFCNLPQENTSSLSDPSHLLLLKDAGTLHSSSQFPTEEITEGIPVRSLHGPNALGLNKGCQPGRDAAFQLPDLCRGLWQPSVAVSGLASSALWLRLSGTGAALPDFLTFSANIVFFLHRYWPYLDGKIREALVLRSIKVRLLISFSRDTDPLTFNFVSSLKAICTEVPSCSLKVVSIIHIALKYKIFPTPPKKKKSKEQKNLGQRVWVNQHKKWKPSFSTSDVHHLLNPQLSAYLQLTWIQSLNDSLQPWLVCQQPMLQVCPALLMLYVTKNYMLLNVSWKLNKKINSSRKLLINNFLGGNTVKVASQVFECQAMPKLRLSVQLEFSLSETFLCAWWYSL